MPVLDVIVIKAFGIHGVSLNKNFKIYLRLQQQNAGSKKCKKVGDEIHFLQKFTFHYDPNHYTREKRLFIELWTESLFGESCVSVAWVCLDTQNFVRGESITLSLRGGFENLQASFMVAIVPIDFGAVSGHPSQQGQPVLGIPLNMHNPPAVTYPPHDFFAAPPVQYSPAPFSGTDRTQCLQAP
ncbi:unnamed protein product [Phytomonas sp. EM1]|nr:unnamed protein product [Phytomonas sp. EM1]|eukprot:CCW64486.1 unnamed protein product [Phytomonas sp. isolate EM1]